MLVARELNRQLPDGGTTVFQRNVPENQLVNQINDIIARRETDGPEPQRWVETPNLIDSTEASDDMDEDLAPPPTTPVRTLPPTEVPPAVFQGPIPQTALNDTPLPTYDQVASRGHAPIYSENDPMYIPITLRTLKRLSDYSTYLFDALSRDLCNRLSAFRRGLANMGFYTRQRALEDMADNDTLQEVADAALYLEGGLKRLCLKAFRRRLRVFEYTTTSVSENEVAEWIAEITRNPENSVRNHARRFTEWLQLLEHTYNLAVLADNSSLHATLSDGSRYLDHKTINLIFHQEEVRDQRTIQGENWDRSSDTDNDDRPTDTDTLLIAEVRRGDRKFPHLYRPNDDRGDYDPPHWHDGSGRGPVHADTGTRIRIPTAFGVPDPRPLPGPNDPREVIELDEDQPMEVIELDVDSPRDVMEID